MDRLKQLIHEIHRRSLWQVLGIHVVGSWFVVQVVQTLTESLGMPLWFPQFAVVLLLIGFPIVLATAFVQEGIGPTRADERSEKASGTSATAEAPALLTWRNAIGGGVQGRPRLGAATGNRNPTRQKCVSSPRIRQPSQRTVENP